jgi:hypothetical protein
VLAGTNRQPIALAGLILFALRSLLRTADDEPLRASMSEVGVISGTSVSMDPASTVNDVTTTYFHLRETTNNQALSPR